jgi:hypothetical protein
MGKSLNIDWNKYKHLLGTDSDNNLTKIINCSAKTIGNARKKFGIPALHSRKWTEEDINLTLNKKRKCTQTYYRGQRLLGGFAVLLNKIAFKI